MSIKCKAYLTVDGAEESSEIRSFRLDEGAATNYDYLRRRIATIFPNLGYDDSSLTLRWRDFSGDMVTFSSDEELVDALGQAAIDGIFRVYVAVDKRKQPKELPWQQFMSEFIRSLNCDPQGGKHQNSRPQSYSNFRPGCSEKRGYGQESDDYGPQSSCSGFPGGLGIGSFPFDFLDEAWSIPRGELFSKKCGGQQQNQQPNHKETTEKQCDNQEQGSSST